MVSVDIDGGAMADLPKVVLMAVSEGVGVCLAAILRS